MEPAFISMSLAFNSAFSFSADKFAFADVLDKTRPAPWAVDAKDIFSAFFVPTRT